MVVYNELVAITAGAGLLGFAAFLAELLRGKRIESEGWAAFFGASGVLLLVLGVPGCDFHNHPALLDTETEKAATATRATTAINNVAGLFLLILGYLR